MTRAVQYTLLVLVFVSAGAAGSLVGTAQSAPTGSPDVLSALLTEVKGLRTAIEQMAAAGPRVQLALGRLQIQEQRVTDLVRRLDVTRKSLTDLQGELQGSILTVKNLEEALTQHQDADRRSGLEQELKHMRSRVQSLNIDAQRVQGEEAALLQDLTNEQTRWSQISQQLDELERSFGRRQ